jgi:endogenous inhibitor of DNA gyrase (YacG/DUF329 family)
MTITAKFSSTCPVCHGRIAAGERVSWQRGQRAQHLGCGNAADPIEHAGYAGFADPGGRSALRAATRSNPRNLPCPTCGRPDQLTPADKRRGYQCDHCADAAEGNPWSAADY